MPTLTVTLNDDGTVYVGGTDDPAAIAWCRSHHKTVVVGLADARLPGPVADLGELLVGLSRAQEGGRAPDVTPEQLAARAVDSVRYWESSGSETYDELVAAVAAAVREAVAAERERCALVAEGWAAGAGYVNDAEGRPLDPRDDIETAGYTIADAIREGT